MTVLLIALLVVFFLQMFVIYRLNRECLANEDMLDDIVEVINEYYTDEEKDKRIIEMSKKIVKAVNRYRY